MAKTDFSIGHNFKPNEYIIMIDEINQITDGTSKQAKSSKLDEHGIPPQKRLFIKILPYHKTKRLTYFSHLK